jgi:hypothetical protein
MTIRPSTTPDNPPEVIAKVYNKKRQNGILGASPSDRVHEMPLNKKRLLQEVSNMVKPIVRKLIKQAELILKLGTTLIMMSHFGYLYRMTKSVSRVMWYYDTI